MSELMKEKMEALITMKAYLEKLIPGFQELGEELRTGRKVDTEEFMKTCIDGINWVIEVFNLTSDIISSEEEIDKEDLNQKIINFSEAIKSKDDIVIAGSIQNEIVPSLSILLSIVGKVIPKEEDNE